MAVPVIAAIVAFIAKSGVKAAIKKYGKNAVNSATKKTNPRGKKIKHKKPKSPEDRLMSIEDKILDITGNGNKSPDSLTPAAQNRLSLLKQRKQNLEEMLEDLSQSGESSADVYGKFSKGGLTKTNHTDYRSKGLFR